jgi:hypothetical protein
MKKAWFILAIIALIIASVPTYFYVSEKISQRNFKNSLKKLHENNILAEVDIRLAKTAMEMFFLDHGKYTDNIEELKEKGLFLNEGTQLTITLTSTGYYLESYHINGTMLYKTEGPSGKLVDIVKTPRI